MLVDSMLADDGRSFSHLCIDGRMRRLLDQLGHECDSPVSTPHSWSKSFVSLLEPVDSLTHVFLSSFDGGQMAVDAILDVLSYVAPNLEQIRIVLDHNTTTTISRSRRLLAEAIRLETLASKASTPTEKAKLEARAAPQRMMVAPVQAAEAAAAAIKAAERGGAVDEGELAKLLEEAERLQPVRDEAVRLWVAAESARLQEEAVEVEANKPTQWKHKQRRLLAEAAEAAQVRTPHQIHVPSLSPRMLHALRRVCTQAEEIPTPAINPGALGGYVRTDGRADPRVKLIYPEVPDGRGTNSYKKQPHGIQHTKILLLRHRASATAASCTAAGSDATSGEHLRVVIASANSEHSGIRPWDPTPHSCAHANLARTRPARSLSTHGCARSTGCVSDSAALPQAHVAFTELDRILHPNRGSLVLGEGAGRGDLGEPASARRSH